MLQHWFGMIPFFGEALMSSAYLFGLFLALLLGERWESICPGQAMDALALALILTGLASVAIQCMQWLEVRNQWLSDAGMINWQIWINESVGARPYANLGQPNQLATLLLWSLLGSAWYVQRRRIGVVVGVLLALYLLFGLALTQSRTGWLGALAILAAVWFWAYLWRSRWVPITVTSLCICFAAMALLLILKADLSIPIGEWTPEQKSRIETGIRPAAWKMFADAALARPWFGYGWDQTSVAFLEVAQRHPPLQSLFSYSHNLFLDLALWCGIPLALLLILTLCTWVIRLVRQVKSGETLIKVLFIAVIGIHAMLEFPLYYAFFLLPVGMIAGTLSGELRRLSYLQSSRATLLSFAVVATILYGLIVKDYLTEVEPNFQAMRFESARIGALPIAEPPDVIVLTHVREWLRLARFQPRAGMLESEVEWVRDVANKYPMPDSLYKIAETYALNGQPDQASIWLSKAHRVCSESNWAVLEASWRRAAKIDPRLAMVKLP